MNSAIKVTHTQESLLFGATGDLGKVPTAHGLLSGLGSGCGDVGVKGLGFSGLGL